MAKELIKEIIMGFNSFFSSPSLKKSFVPITQVG
jgi:hypothetical protein